MATAPPELITLRERMAELTDLGAVSSLLFWDQNTMTPHGAAAARADQAGSLERVLHERLTDPEVGWLLDALAPWAAGEDPESEDVRLLHWVRRDYEKATRVPTDLAVELTHAAALGEQAWLEARAASDFGRFRDALARHIELKHRYVACFEGFAHPYDALLDDYEPELTAAELRPLFSALGEGLTPLVAAAGDPEQPSNGGVFAGHYPADEQRRTVLEVLEVVGFRPDAWRLDPAPHPFAMSVAAGDVRITTRYDDDDFGMAFFSALHEFGHGLYESQVDPALHRTPLGVPVSLGVHESQSRLWENLVGRSRPFSGWVLPRLQSRLEGPLAGLGPDELYRAVNTVKPSLIRVEADETTYNLHVVLRFELELAMIEGTLAVDDLPQAWNEGMARLLGVAVPDDAHGVLQDVHWGAGMIGYFPTYTIGNLMAAQLWERLRADLPDVDERIAAGEFAPLREWLRENIHRHGRKLAPRDLLRRVTGEELRVEPFIGYLSAKLADAGLLGGAR
jgi:carboxypeptidase Taq